MVVGKKVQLEVTGIGKISYTSSNTKIAVVSSTGVIKAKAPGKVKITVKADGGTNCYAASKTFTIKVNPKSTKILSVKNTGEGQITVKWKKVAGVTGYQVRYGYGSEKESVNVKRAAVVSKKIKKLTAGKVYKVYVRTYKFVSGKKYYSAWSKVKKVRVTR